MYYLITGGVYFLVVMIFLKYVRKPNQDDSELSDEVFLDEMLSGLTKSDVKNRKVRVKILPLSSRILYWIWFTSILVVTFAPFVITTFSKELVIGLLYIPSNAFYFDCNTPSLLFFGFGGFLMTVPIFIAYFYLTYRGTIKQAHDLYRLISPQLYPIRTNIYNASLCILVGLPMMMLGFNSYRYFTAEHIVVKSALALNEKIYTYSEVKSVVKTVTKKGVIYYDITLNDYVELTLFYEISDNQEFMATLKANNIIIEVKPFNGIFGFDENTVQDAFT